MMLTSYQTTQPYIAGTQYSGLNLIGSGQGTVAQPFEHGNETSVSVKQGGFLD
jgi:hypothetical protein